MKNKLQKVLKDLPLIAFIVVFMGSIIANIIGYNYIEELESQIIQRDSVITKLSFSNNLVNEYFDVNEDSVTKQPIYTLKDEKKTKIFHTKTEYQKQCIVVEPSFVRGDKVLTAEELLDIVNSEDSIFASKLAFVAEKYKDLARDYNEIIKKENKLRDSIMWQKMALGLIKRNYDIDYSSWIENNVYHVKLESSKADSAFVLFPYFKHKMKYDEGKKNWIIRK